MSNLHRFRFCLALTAASLSVLAGCVSTSAREAAGAGATPLTAAAGARVEDYVLVDCLLPGQIRQLGTRMTYLTPRRSVKATQRDCGIRGGEYVLFDRSDYGSALQALLPKARGGDPVAQTYVGEIYEKGLGLAGPDYASAAQWYRKAANSDHVPAQVSLGSLYERGLGVPNDKAQALNWYRRGSGLSQDKLIFESALKAERAAFNRELALRNQVAASLNQQLRQARQLKASAPSGPKASATAAAVSTEKLERLVESQRRDAEQAAGIKDKQLRALNQVTEEKSGKGADSGGKAAQAGKLKLTLREQRDELLDTSRRLASASQ
ncbi:MAG: tetratricopeptide repeat protein [Thiohalocapsa sp.]